MSPRLRIASISVASATALSVLIGTAPPAFAEPCTGAAAAVQPPNAEPTPELPGINRRPEGQRPTGANDDAPLPELGQLGDFLSSQSSRNGQVQQQAAVVPQPTPPDAATQPNAQPLPVPAAAPPVPPAPPGTSIVGWVTGPDSPNDTIKKFAITGTDLGIMWDNGDPGNRQVLMAFGDTYGYCGVRGQQWRYNTLFRTRDGALAKTIEVPNGAVSDQYSGSPLWAPGLSKQIINSIKFAVGDGHHPVGRHRRRRQPVRQLHVHQELGQRRPVDDELLGDRGLSRQRRALGCLPGLRPARLTRQRRPGRLRRRK